jgi:hypothetical protein
MIRILSTIHTIACALGFYLSNREIIELFSLGSFIIGTYYYCKKGFRSYRHQTPQICLLISTTHFVSISISIFIMPFTEFNVG